MSDSKTRISQGAAAMACFLLGAMYASINPSSFSSVKNRFHERQSAFFHASPSAPAPTAVQVPAPVPTPESRCPSPIVYNKPHKTASTTIREELRAWAKAQNRRFYTCSSFIGSATMMMRECIPPDHSGCAVVGTHLIHSPMMRQILLDKIGDYQLITSTRDPRARILSYFLQMHGAFAASSKVNVTELKTFLKEHNPWDLYNYHTGEARTGSCPMSEAEKLLLNDVANRYDVIVDAEVPEVSNAILKKYGLFQLSGKVSNKRGSSLMELDKETEKLIDASMCVEVELHRLFRLRMASVYGKIKKKNCVIGNRDPHPCFEMDGWGGASDDRR